MEERLYREKLLEIYRNPQNRGEISNPDLEAKMVNPLCGDEIKLQLKLANRQLPIANRKIQKAVFSGNGCAISQASASILANHIEGRKLAEIKKLDVSDVLKLVGVNPSPARLKCAVLSLEVLKEAINGVQGKS
ncbi:MAG TPA: iron-sulfur cluster assembly scaffold protein [Candidatus Nanoarchaeia archaeon]